MKLKVILLSAAVLFSVLGLSAKNRALLIGIGNYNTAETGWTVIHGNNDVALLKGKLMTNGFTVTTLSDAAATKAGVKASLDRLSKSCENGDVVYLHFSGHGQLVEDYNNDEQDELDQSFICYDACFSPRYKSNGTAYRGQNHLVDDELFPYLNTIKQKIGKNGQLVVVFDSCYSGGADRGELKDDPDPESEVEWDETTRGSSDEFQVNRSSENYLRTIRKPGKYSSAGGSVTVISACPSDRRNYECKERHSGRKYGSLSYCISRMIDKKIPITQWGSYFSTGKYKSLRIFRPSQTPVVETH